MAKRVLIVDSDVMYLKMAQFILKQIGYESVLVNSGYEGIDKLRSERIDLVLLALEMPDMDGIETLKHIREGNGLENLPVVFTAVSYGKKSTAAAEELGAKGCIRKPFAPDELLEKVTKVLE